MNRSDALPIHTVIPRLLDELSLNDRVVLQAAPGAGKTTVVPLKLLKEPWLADRKIVMLEPRRLAARGAAVRLAQSLGEKVGKRVGYRMRGETRVSPATRIEVVTEGVLTQMLLHDPSLEDIGLLIFDEFHERSIHADLSLALSLQTQELLRDDLKILVMSATLQTEAVAELLRKGDEKVPVITGEGRTHPVEYRYLDIKTPLPAPERIADTAALKTVEMLEKEEGDVLVFLPGAKEIRRTESLLRRKISDQNIIIAPLYGTMEPKAQRLAVEPAPAGKRKVVLGTNIAETSLTIEGVRIVIDSGLERSVFFDAAAGMNRYKTLPISQNSAIQRAGRAGREAPGICVRLWHENRRLVEYAQPEILRSDLAPLMMSLAAWGARPEELKWIDPPPAHTVGHAEDLLRQLGMTDERGTLTPHGKEVLNLGHHPRIAHMLLKAKTMGLGYEAALLAVLLQERPPLGGESDLSLSLETFHRTLEERSFGQFKKSVEKLLRELNIQKYEDINPLKAGILVAMAYPERIAKWRGEGDRYLSVSGKGLRLKGSDSLIRTPWLAVAEAGGTGTEATIFSAARLSEEDLHTLFSDRFETFDDLRWHDEKERIDARRITRFGAVTIKSEPLQNPDPDLVAETLLKAVAQKGLGSLPWDKKSLTLRKRVEFARRHRSEDFPDLSDEALLETLHSWLLPYIRGTKSLKELQKLDMYAILTGLLGWQRLQSLDRLAPERIEVPSGSKISIDYSDPENPVLPVKLQELFGWQKSPEIMDAKVALTLHLLSPANRPLAVTKNLKTFWQNAYNDIRKEMRGRYPKHYWPEDPLTAVATNRTKKGMSKKI
ncbi:ATP-dependent helicase HrpB [Hydrogenimonas sp.]|nr:ATP-dependent helicase HrpB [Hydrogenimonas sp.]